MPNMMRCPQCGEEIDMSEEPIFCEYCGGSLLDVRTVNDDRTVLAPPPGPITNDWIQQHSFAPEEFEKPAMAAPKEYHYVK